MSLGDAEASSSNSRDWFFPAPPPPQPKTIANPRRFSTTSRFSKPYLSDSKPPKPPPLHSSTPLRDTRYAGIRHRISRRSDVFQKSDQDHHHVEVPKAEVVSDDKTSADGGFIGLSGDRIKFRWYMLSSAVILITIFSSMLHKNFTLHSQVDDLQHQIAKLNARLRACSSFDSREIVDSLPQENVQIPNKSLKISALIVSLTLLSTPFLAIKYVDYVSKSRRYSDNISEEVSLNKQIAYRVDVLLSVHPYAKPLGLLVATLLLIGLGGLALFGVTDDGLADCFWLSWTYVADSGNHANSEGIGPRLVSVSISFGGMLIFAMMLGLVSDSISEKLDSLRKGRSKVVEQNHTLILGWSDKLVISDSTVTH